MTDIYCHGLYPRRRPRNRTIEREAYLRENVGIDPAILAADLGIQTSWVLAWQRKLGIRPFSCNGAKYQGDEESEA